MNNFVFKRFLVGLGFLRKVFIMINEIIFMSVEQSAIVKNAEELMKEIRGILESDKSFAIAAFPFDGDMVNYQRFIFSHNMELTRK